MDERALQSRLDRITTQWTMVFEAHSTGATDAQTVRVELLQRYRGAVYRYLLAVARDPDVAEELSQQFALKFLEGEFHKATPKRGRFRDYVKATLINLVRRHYKMQATAPGALHNDIAAVSIDTETDDISSVEFASQWRTEVLNLTWTALRTKYPVYHDLLRLRVDDPNLSSRELAEQYSERFSKTMTASNVRKTLERAHDRFADLLVKEVAESLQHANRDNVRTELLQLDLLKYCRSAVQNWSPADD